MRTSLRRGFTLVELLIVIAIIGLLMGLLLPAIQAARERARMNTCSNNQRNVALAIFNKTTSGNGEYPSYAEFIKVTSGGTKIDLAVPWPVKLLPRLENQTLYQQLVTDNGGAGFGQAPALAIFACPSDASTNPDLGVLSYVINTGYPDPLDDIAAGDASDVEANGIAHDVRPQRNGPKVTGTDISDGADSTLLLTENVSRDVTTWLGPVQMPDSAAAGNLDANMNSNPEQRYGFVWVYDDGTAPDQPPADVLAPINREPEIPPANYTAEGMVYARPASAHPEVVIVAFAGGAVRELSETIDYAVYQQLMTPKGLKAQIPRSNSPYYGPPPQYLETPQRTFMLKPLSQGDY